MKPPLVKLTFIAILLTLTMKSFGQHDYKKWGYDKSKKVKLVKDHNGNCRYIDKEGRFYLETHSETNLTDTSLLIIYNNDGKVETAIYKELIGKDSSKYLTSGVFKYNYQKKKTNIQEIHFNYTSGPDISFDTNHITLEYSETGSLKREIRTRRNSIYIDVFKYNSENLPDSILRFTNSLLFYSKDTFCKTLDSLWVFHITVYNYDKKNRIIKEVGIELGKDSQSRFKTFEYDKFDNLIREVVITNNGKEKQLVKNQFSGKQLTKSTQLNIENGVIIGKCITRFIYNERNLLTSEKSIFYDNFTKKQYDNFYKEYHYEYYE